MIDPEVAVRSNQFGRVNTVQTLHWASGVPEVAGKLIKFLDFAGIQIHWGSMLLRCCLTALTNSSMSSPAIRP